jgi:hypothetical protein
MTLTWAEVVSAMAWRLDDYSGSQGRWTATSD